MLASRHSSRSPLLHFDDEKGINKPLRYARNQKSPFEDEQDGNAILEPVVFEDGLLFVEATNQVLQHFLALHPQNGMLFEEIDAEKDASEELAWVERALDAQIVAKELSTEKLVMVCRVIMGAHVDKMTIPELKRDILMYSKNEPEDFLGILDDPMLDLQDSVFQLFDKGVIAIRNNNKDVYFNLPKNKQKMLTVPFGEEPSYIVASYFQSDDGIETYKLLKKYLNKDEK
tara:strand:+ start:348 stop:1037 length:690 start_codon:yes stop_codon:yes gene_type:complete